MTLHSTVTSWMYQYPKLTSINLSSRVLSPPLLCCYITQANLLSPFLRHRSINLFLLAYQRIWIETEEYSFEEKLVQDLAVSTRVILKKPQFLYEPLGRTQSSIRVFLPEPLIYGKHDITADVRAS